MDKEIERIRDLIQEVKELNDADRAAVLIEIAHDMLRDTGAGLGLIGYENVSGAIDPDCPCCVAFAHGRSMSKLQAFMMTINDEVPTKVIGTPPSQNMN